jgi:hypothetical protein
MALGNACPEQDGAEQQHQDGESQVRCWIRTCDDMAHSNECVAPLGYYAYKRCQGKVPLDLSRGAQEEDCHGQVENAGNLNLTDVQWRPRRDDAEEPSRESEAGNTDAQVNDATKYENCPEDARSVGHGR